MSFIDQLTLTNIFNGDVHGLNSPFHITIELQNNKNNNLNEKSQFMKLLKGVSLC